MTQLLYKVVFMFHDDGHINRRAEQFPAMFSIRDYGILAPDPKSVKQASGV
jgi:hypothetical protein